MSGLDNAISQMGLDHLSNWEMERIDSRIQSFRYIETIDSTIAELEQEQASINEALTLFRDYFDARKEYIDRVTLNTMNGIIMDLNDTNVYCRLQNIIYRGYNWKFIDVSDDKSTVLKQCKEYVLDWELRRSYEDVNKFPNNRLIEAYDKFLKPYFTIEQFRTIFEETILSADSDNWTMRDFKTNALNDAADVLKLSPTFERLKHEFRTPEQRKLVKLYADFMTYETEYQGCKRQFSIEIYTNRWKQIHDLKYWIEQTPLDRFKEDGNQFKILITKCRERVKRSISDVYNGWDGSDHKHEYDIIAKLKQNESAIRYCSEFIYRHSEPTKDNIAGLRKRLNQITPYLDELKQTRERLNTDRERYQVVVSHQRAIDELNAKLQRLDKHDYMYAINMAKLIVEIDAIRKLL